MLNSEAGRGTAIMATLGPISQSRSCIEGMVRAGLDVVRLSLSSGTRDWHAAVARHVREAAAAAGRPVQLLADLQGRKNRLGVLPGGRAQWSDGEVVTLTVSRSEAHSHQTWTLYPWLVDRVPAGGRVLIDDGAIVLDIVDVSPAEVRCVVSQGGLVTSGRGLSMPGSSNVLPGLTDRDVSDLRFAQQLGADIVALSFACSAADYHELRSLAPHQLLVGKVEHPQALRELEDMAEAFDGLMVARGDLAVEIPFEDVPFVQKRIVAECARRRKSSIVATQLLHSMRESRMPSRAEVSDVANAVLDGASALLVTGETGYGLHPVRVVEVLRTVIRRAELYLDQSGKPVNGGTSVG
ncbi:pyruvate kinase [Longispora albida]|uniref:pyruvate kinase n=1 Tax=Longispora albida TaxID=203523 RepID=UPI000363C02B|nr:pyruvate kinase [Longispora albida]